MAPRPSSKVNVAKSSDSGSDDSLSEKPNRTPTTNTANSLKRKKGESTGKPAKQPKVVSLSDMNDSDSSGGGSALNKSSSSGESENGEDESNDESDSASSSRSTSPDDAHSSTRKPTTPASRQTKGHARQRSRSSSSSSASASPSPSPRNPNYAPPNGFKEVPRNTKGKDTLQKILAPMKLTGKELWHISVPASLPITSILSAVQNKPKAGELLLSHNGVGYALRSSKGPEDGVMLPHYGGTMYKTSDTRTPRRDVAEARDTASGFFTYSRRHSCHCQIDYNKDEEDTSTTWGAEDKVLPAGFEQSTVDTQGIGYALANGVAVKQKKANSMTSKMPDPRASEKHSDSKVAKVRRKEVAAQRDIVSDTIPETPSASESSSESEESSASELAAGNISSQKSRNSEKDDSSENESSSESEEKEEL